MEQPPVISTCCMQQHGMTGFSSMTVWSLAVEMLMHHFAIAPVRTVPAPQQMAIIMENKLELIQFIGSMGQDGYPYFSSITEFAQPCIPAKCRENAFLQKRIVELQAKRHPIRIGHCYDNCFRLSQGSATSDPGGKILKDRTTKEDIEYVEGIVYSENTKRIFLHAWVKINGISYDPTLELSDAMYGDSNERQYVGIYSCFFGPESNPELPAHFDQLGIKREFEFPMIRPEDLKMIWGYLREKRPEQD
ncbi:hypothetical protein [Geothrix sp. 21YS21S-2]|uniref:hypothetical protein n=1 Tax=Geothrix sp. 21YS21S-2 TaxID=3068893 RepID=UPI0027BA5D41|nr:hypothetical protein [Geothrix sp. 21YS21S-2]